MIVMITLTTLFEFSPIEETPEPLFVPELGSISHGMMCVIGPNELYTAGSVQHSLFVLTICCYSN